MAPTTQIGIAFAIAAFVSISAPATAQVKTDATEIGPVAPPKLRPNGAQKGPSPNSWFERTRVDLGTFIEGEVGVGKFPFKNPSSESHRISHLQPNCQCAKAQVVVGGRRYVVENDPVPQTIYRLETVDGKDERTKVKHIVVAGGESGHVEVHLDLKGIKGQKEAFVSMRTSDEKLPMTTVTARAKGVAFFKVVPPDVNLNKMTWDEKREFSFEISSDVQADFEVTEVDSTNEELVVTAKTKSMRGDRAVWRIDGRYGPNVSPRGGGGVLKVKTNVKNPKNNVFKTKDVRVIAMVEGPMTVRPGTFLPLGRIKRKVGASKVVEFEPNGQFDLQFEGVELENLSVDKKWVSVATSKEGKVLKLELKVEPGAPRRLIRGDIKVTLNHPAVKEKALQFNGFVR